MSQFWIIGGPNGAGKTTIADRYFAPRLIVVSPDRIAANLGVSPVEAGRRALLLQENLLARRANFALDTTFSGKREIGMLRRARDAGYKTNLVFVCVTPAVLCHLRVMQRVSAGGHDVPLEDVMRRYHRSLQNLATAAPLVDRALLVDNSGPRRRLVLTLEAGRVRHRAGNLPEWVHDALPNNLLRRQGNKLNP